MHISFQVRSPRMLGYWGLSVLILSLSLITGLAAALRPAPQSSPQNLLWQIGKQDGGDGEFALAPGGYAKFQDDGFFMVGKSDSKLDWPYVHPGPNDAWAGQRPHAFMIIFGLRALPAAGACRLHIALLDTQRATPPVLDVEINGTSFRQKLPPGAGDASVAGRPERGAPYHLVVEFPLSLLKNGQNEICLRTVSGSWLLYDWIGLEAPAGLELAPMTGPVIADAMALQALVERDGRLQQPVRCVVRHAGEALPARISVNQAAAEERTLQQGKNTFEFLIPAVDKESSAVLALEVNGRAFATRNLALKPVRRLTVYILPHSHTDIGYTEIQTEIEDKQVQNLLQGIAVADYRAREGKESLNFGFPFAVPGGQMRLEVPFGVVRPDQDQIPSACKNWFTVGRWADVANDRFGLT